MAFSPLRFAHNIALAQNSPQPNNMFRVLIGGDPLGSFLKVSGIGYSVEPFELKEGGRNESAHMRPFGGPGKFNEVTLEWGSVKRGKMESWAMSVAPGYAFRRNVFIIQTDRKGVPFRIYTLYGAWPKSWQVGDMDARGNDLATESLTLVYEGIITVAI